MYCSINNLIIASRGEVVTYMRDGDSSHNGQSTHLDRGSKFHARYDKTRTDVILLLQKFEGMADTSAEVLVFHHVTFTL